MLQEIEQCLEPPLEISSEELKKLDSELEELTKQGFGVERLPEQTMIDYKVLCTYPKISPEFLRMSNQKEWKNNYNYWKGFINIPKFGVYNINNQNMSIRFGHSNRYFFEIVQPENFPHILGKNLALSSEIFSDDIGKELVNYYDDNYHNSRLYSRKKTGLSKEIRKKFHYSEVQLGITFNGIIPTETRKKILEAKKYFSNNLFIIAETKPEEWSPDKFIPRIVKDPLLIGTRKENCFYIDSFNTTPLEHYIKSEFAF